jgi:anti-sigma B factor antagonist
VPSGDPRTGELRADAVVVDGSVCLRVQGELDLATACELRQACEVVECALRPGVSVVVDLAELRFVDAAGLGALVRLRNRLRSAGADLTVVDPSPQVRRVFEHAGLGGILDADAATEDGTPAPR